VGTPVTDLTTLADAADALTNPIRVRERIEWWDDNRNKKYRYHEHTVASLLDQLHGAMVPGEAYVEDEGGYVRRTPRSIPPARLEAINASLMIDAGAGTWVIRVGLTIRDTTAGNIRSLVGAQTDSDTAEEILRDLRRWYGWAATLSGWERAPWKPEATCPLCAERGTLRVHFARKAAACVACHESWTEDTIGLLADHIRDEADRTPPHSETRETARLFALIRLDSAVRRQRLLDLAGKPNPDLPYISA
jgi:hypothetical protein